MPAFGATRLTSAALSAVVLTATAGLVGYFVYRYLYKRKTVLLQDGNTRYAVTLIDKKIISHDTRRFRFAFPSSSQYLGLPVGQHIYFNAKIDGKTVIRPYTPVSSDDESGYMDMVIKVYFKGTHPKFPDGGQMSQYLENLSLGDTIEIRGPSGNCVYEGNGLFRIKRGKDTVMLTKKRVGLIAGGTGITPMYQIIKKILKNSNDSTEVWLLFANQSEDDILIREELEAMQAQYPQRFRSLWFTVDKKTSPQWRYDEGFVSEDIIRAHLPAPGSDVLILSCGPPPMIKFAVVPNLGKIGYEPDMHHEY